MFLLRSGCILEEAIFIVLTQCSLYHLDCPQQFFMKNVDMSCISLFSKIKKNTCRAIFKESEFLAVSPMNSALHNIFFKDSTLPSMVISLS